jgi:hypothetical protein
MIFIQLICAAVLISCASSVPLKPQEKMAIQIISINNHVKMPEEMLYKGPEVALGAFGTVGEITAEFLEMTNKEKIKYLMNKYDIDVAQIVREQFTNELEAGGVFNSIVPAGGDGKIKLWVRIYGISYELSGKLKPVLGVEGSLLGSNDSVVWKKYAYVTNFNDMTPGNSMEQFISNPELIREAFEISAILVAQDLVKHMQGKK